MSNLVVYDYDCGRISKINGVPLPDYTLFEQLLLRILVYCFWSDEYRECTMPEALEAFREKIDSDREFDGNRLVDWVDYNKIKNIIDRLDDECIVLTLVRLPGGYELEGVTPRKCSICEDNPCCC